MEDSCHLGDTEVPLVTDVSEVLKVKPVHLVVTVRALAEHGHKSRVVGTFLKHHHNTVTKAGTWHIPETPPQHYHKAGAHS